MTKLRATIVQFLQPAERPAAPTKLPSQPAGPPDARLKDVLHDTLTSMELEALRKSSKIERRVYDRYPSRLKGACHPIAADKGRTWKARVKDVSSGGIGLVLDRSFRPGTVLFLSVQARESDAPHVIVARVVQAREESTGEWHIGCQFATPISHDEVVALLS